MSDKVAVVTGSNKGIGYSIVKKLCQRYDGVVYLTSRDEVRGRKAVAELKKLGLNPEFHQLDVADKESVRNFRDYIQEKHGGIDILINNAAIGSSIMKSNYEEDKKLLDINYKSMHSIKELIFPIIRNNGRILNISSDAGHLSNIRNKYWIDRLLKEGLKEEDVDEFVEWYLEGVKNGTFKTEDLVDNGTFASYRISKVAMSALTRVHQKELESRNISVNSMYPGLVKTDMTMKVGFLTADQAAETPVYLVLDAPESLKGAYVWYDKKIVDWCDFNAKIYFTAALYKSWFLHSMFSNFKNYIMSFFQ